MEEDQPRMKVSGTQANTGLEPTCPLFRPPDSWVTYGKGRPLPRVTRRQETWPTANPLHPVPPGLAKVELQRPDTTQEDVTRTREHPYEADEVKEEPPKQVTELEDDNRTRERPDEVGEVKEGKVKHWHKANSRPEETDPYMWTFLKNCVFTHYQENWDFIFFRVEFCLKKKYKLYFL